MQRSFNEPFGFPNKCYKEVIDKINKIDVLRRIVENASILQGAWIGLEDQAFVSDINRVITDEELAETSYTTKISYFMDEYFTDQTFGALEYGLANGMDVLVKDMSSEEELNLPQSEYEMLGNKYLRSVYDKISKFLLIEKNRKEHLNDRFVSNIPSQYHSWIFQDIASMAQEPMLLENVVDGPSASKYCAEHDYDTAQDYGKFIAELYMKKTRRLKPEQYLEIIVHIMNCVRVPVEKKLYWESIWTSLRELSGDVAAHYLMFREYLSPILTTSGGDGYVNILANIGISVGHDVKIENISRDEVAQNLVSQTCDADDLGDF